MRQIILATAVVFSSLAFCQKTKMKTQKKVVKQTTTTATATATPAPEQKLIPLESLGEFPYLKAPSGYYFRDPINRGYEEKYFFENGKIKTVAGKYFMTPVWSNDGVTFEDTYLVKMLRDEIVKKGGKLIYSGGSPSDLWKKVNEENPNYIKDIYDPYPYSYKQYMIPTDKGNVWFEMIHGLNTSQVDLTVMLEEKK